MQLSRFALVGLLAVLACSKSEDTSQPQTPTTGSDAGPTLVDFTMYAVDPGENPSKAWTAVAGAAAFLDTAAGARIEATSEADGRIVFKGVDFSAGPVSVTGYLAGHVMGTVVGITPEGVAKLPLPAPTFAAGGKNALLFLPLETYPAEDTAKVSGSFKNKLDPANMISLTTVNGRTSFEQSSDTYSLQVLKGQPLTFIAMEWNGGATGTNGWSENKLRWLKLDIPAQTADATVDLDLATGTAMTPTKVTVTLKMKDASGLGRSPGWQVNSMEHPNAYFVGSRNTVTANADNQTFTAVGEYVTSPSASDTPFTLAYFPGRAGTSAIVQHSGYPKDGDTIEALAYPQTPSTSVVGGDIVLGGIDPAAEAVGIQYVDHQPNNDRALWQIATLQFAPIPTSIHIPDLPEAARAMLTGTLRGRVTVAAGKMDDKLPNIAGRFATSAFFALGK